MTKTYRDKRPQRIRTFIPKEEENFVYSRQWRESRRNIAHICSAEGFIRYRDGMEDEGYIIDYYEYFKNKSGMSPFDLIRSKILNKINQKQKKMDEYISYRKRQRLKY